VTLAIAIEQAIYLFILLSKVKTEIYNPVSSKRMTPKEPAQQKFRKYKHRCAVHEVQEPEDLQPLAAT
jgi:hypothetical protein